MKPIHWRRTRIGRYLRHLPRPKHIRGTWLHRCCGDRLFANELWHPTRQRFAAGLAVGVFFGLLPLPFQMLAAALIAYITRVNLPLAIAGTWVSNPFTFAPIWYLQYRVGCVILGREPGHFESSRLLESLGDAPVAFFVGVFPVAALGAITIYPVTLLAWDRVTAGLQASRLRHAERRARKRSVKQ
jgi:uncharacterized protein